VREFSLVDAFATWLKTNGHRLPAKLVACPSRGPVDKRSYRFRGVPLLRVAVGASSFEVWVLYRRWFVDQLPAVDDVLLMRG
jgi:hypothetical protein